jgi:hypothetical protein
MLDVIRAAFKAMTCRSSNPLPKPRRRRGETDKGIVATCLTMLHKTAAAARGPYAALQPAPKVQDSAARENTISVPTEFFYVDPDWNMFDIANPLYDHGDNAGNNDHWYEEDFSAKQDHFYPQP